MRSSSTARRLTGGSINQFFKMSSFSLHSLSTMPFINVFQLQTRHKQLNSLSLSLFLSTVLASGARGEEEGCSAMLGGSVKCCRHHLIFSNHNHIDLIKAQYFTTSFRLTIKHSLPLPPIPRRHHRTLGVPHRSVRKAHKPCLCGGKAGWLIPHLMVVVSSNYPIGKRAWQLRDYQSIPVRT